MTYIRKNRKKSKKSQVWTIEFILSFLIFTAAVILSVKSIFNIYTNENLRDIQRESEFVSQYLLSDGFPDDWDNNTVIRAGLTTNNRLNDTKIISLYNLEYGYAKEALGIKNSNFFIYFSNSSGIFPLFHIVNNSIPESDGCGYGYYGVVKQYTAQCEIDVGSLKYTDMTKISRITNYNGSVVLLNLLIWR